MATGIKELVSDDSLRLFCIEHKPTINFCELKAYAPKDIEKSTPLYVFIRLGTVEFQHEGQEIKIGCSAADLQVIENGFSVLSIDKFGEQNLLEEQSAEKHAKRARHLEIGFQPEVNVKGDSVSVKAGGVKYQRVSEVSAKATTQSSKAVVIAQNGNSWRIESNTDEFLSGLIMDHKQLCVFQRNRQSNHGQMRIAITVSQKDLKFEKPPTRVFLGLKNLTDEKLSRIAMAKQCFSPSPIAEDYRGKLCVGYVTIQDFEE